MIPAIRTYTWKVVVREDEAGVTIDVEPVEPTGDVAADSSRRDFLKKAVIASWSVPLIVSITANRAMAATADVCLGAGSGCTPSLTTPRSTCCAQDSEGDDQICCASGTTNQTTCRKAPTEPCDADSDCCNACVGGFCT